MVEGQCVAWPLNEVTIHPSWHPPPTLEHGRWRALSHPRRLTREMPELPGLVGSIGGALVGLTFFAGVLIQLVGRLLHRPFWKVGPRLSYGAVASLGLVAGLYLLAVAPLFSLPGSDRIEGLLIIGVGAIWIAASVVALRWVRAVINSLKLAA